jgi:uncharacterized circularly permuted ATP-grasp superfamily protein/uncharacterized alpha-E superfamily protein
MGPMQGQYQTAAGQRDEALDGGLWRAGWAAVGEEFARLGDDGLARRWEAARRQLRENGVAYNAYGDGEGHERPWQLDPVPWVITAAEWRGVVAGVTQRARLLDAVLADCYGDQRLLRERLLPPGALFGHPGFLRPLHGVVPPGGRHLVLYAVDLVRDTAGAWQVLSDRTQVPTGAGYALENRVVLSRALPELYASLGVERVANWFLAFKQALLRLAPRHRDNPRVVLLSAGPRSETYFEQAYLARYLGLTLVEGADLAVRDGGVYLKTLVGLKPVDVILRRLDDDYCDPLELRNESLLGVAGLVEAVRRGTVAIANPLGSGLAENAALVPHLPALARRLLGEDLLIPSVPTTWGPDGVAARIAAGEDLVVRHAFAGSRSAPKVIADLGGDEREALAAEVRARPEAWVATPRLEVSTAPVWHDGVLRPHTLVLRTFAVAGADGCTVFPGGLARVSPEGERAVGATQRGGGSKDVWVRADGPVEPVTLMQPAGAVVELRRGSIELPSRVADNFFWLGRYAERTDDTARLLRAVVGRLGDDHDPAARGELACLSGMLESMGLPDPTRGKDAQGAAAAAVLDGSNKAALTTVLARLQDSAFAVRDRIANDLWRALSRLRSELSAIPAKPAPGELLALLDRAVLSLAAVAGLGSENTTRGPAWRFLDIGRRIERASFTLDLLGETLGAGVADQTLEAVLEVCDGSLTYRGRYLTALQAPAVLDLLLTDNTNPRSVAFQLEAVLEHVGRLPRDQERALPTQPERLALGTHTWMRLLDPHQLCRRDETGARAELKHVLEHLGSDLSVLSDALTSQFLTHATTSRNLGG